MGDAVPPQLTVRPVTPEDRPVVERVTAAYPYLPITRKYGVTREQIVEYLAGRVVEAAARPASAVLLACQGDEPRGLVGLDPLPWESTVFGKRMAGVPFLLAVGADTRVTYAVLIEATKSLASEKGVEHIACRFRADDVALTNSLEAAGFFLADSTLEVGWDMERTRVEETQGEWIITDAWGRTTKFPCEGVTTRPVAGSDVPAMRELAREAFTGRTQTRYTADPTLSPGAAGELYAQWFEKSCRGEFADFVAVAVEDGEPIGFHTTKLDRPLSSVVGRKFALSGITAIMPGKTGRALAVALHASVLRWYQETGVGFARGRVLVQNTGMLRGLLLMGATVFEAYHTFHYTPTR